MADEPDATTADAEVTAIRALVKYLAPLEPHECHRVLRWAEERFVSATSTLDPEAFEHFTRGLAAAAHELGDVSAIDVLKASRAFVEWKRKHEEAA